jgi:hypothetical protein
VTEKFVDAGLLSPKTLQQGDWYARETFFFPTSIYPTDVPFVGKLTGLTAFAVFYMLVDGFVRVVVIRRRKSKSATGNIDQVR